jgi:hypothetical protein
MPEYNGGIELPDSFDIGNGLNGFPGNGLVGER